MITSGAIKRKEPDINSMSVRDAMEGGGRLMTHDEEFDEEICMCGRFREIGFFIQGKPVWLCEVCDEDDEL